MTDRLARATAGLLLVALGAWLLPACGGSTFVVSSDPAQPYHRSPSADVSKVKGVAVHFVEVKANTKDGEEFIKPVFFDSLKSWVGPKYGPVTEGSTAPAGGAVLDVTIMVNWGSHAARKMVGGGAGRAGIVIRYDLKDERGNLLAKMHTSDTMTAGFYGGDPKELVFSAATKWSRFFVEQVLQAPIQSGD